MIINKKIDLEINGKKHRIYGFKEVNQKLLSFCELEEYQVEVIEK